jgi:uncharacterized protein YndB with AHSA1/START domain
MNNSKTEVITNLKEKSVLVSREFKAPLDNVWRAFTEPEILDQWWGPAPWRAETKSMDFKVGGHWLYAMVGPENEKHWARMDYLGIEPLRKIHIKDSFCDEKGTINTSLPVSEGQNVFTKTADGTRVEWKMIYPDEKDVQTIIDMGFEQGIRICMEQLEKLLK